MSDHHEAAVRHMLENAAEMNAVIRVPCHPPLSRMQLTIAALLSEGWHQHELAEILVVTRRTIEYHVDEASPRIPGDLPRTAKLMAWYRGATLAVLTGKLATDTADSPGVVRAARRRALAIAQGRGCPVCGYDGVHLIEPARKSETVSVLNHAPE